MAIEREPFNWRLFLTWLVTSTLGWLIGMMLGNGLAFLNSPPQPYSEIGGPTPSSAISYMVGFLVVGLVQWITLRKVLDDAWQWIVATAGGALAGGLIDIGLTYALFAPVMMRISAYPTEMTARQQNSMILGWSALTALATALGYGLTVGLFQWLILRLNSRRAGWWIFAVVGAVALSDVVETSLHLVLYRLTILLGETLPGPNPFADYGVQLQVSSLIPLVLAAACYAALTGLALVILRRGADRQIEPEDDLPPEDTVSQPG